jgi:hypothetical protein
MNHHRRIRSMMKKDARKRMQKETLVEYFTLISQKRSWQAVTQISSGTKTCRVPNSGTECITVYDSGTDITKPCNSWKLHPSWATATRLECGQSLQPRGNGNREGSCKERDSLVAEAVRRWLPTAAARVRIRAGIWALWWTKRHWGRFSPSTSDYPANHHSTNFSITITRGWHNRPIGGRSVEWTQFDSTPQLYECGTV